MTLVTKYETYDEYIRWLAKREQTTLKQMCADLNIPYVSFKSGYLSKRMRDGRRDAVMNYLKGDSDILDSLPLKSELSKTNET